MSDCGKSVIPFHTTPRRICGPAGGGSGFLKLNWGVLSVGWGKNYFKDLRHLLARGNKKFCDVIFSFFLIGVEYR